jgi:hypothetical protein
MSVTRHVGTPFHVGRDSGDYLAHALQNLQLVQSSQGEGPCCIPSR